MSIYDIDYKQTTRQLLPPDKRGPIMKAWLNALLKPAQWLRDLWLGDYRTGSSGLPWLDSTIYSKGERVTYKGSAYESLKDGNLNNNPLDVTWWMLVQDNFIGVFERILYTGSGLIFDYAMNKYFGTVFRQPPNISDIYVQVHPKQAQVFLVGGIESNSSQVFTNRSSEFVIDSYSFSTYYNMTIYVPASVFNALDTDPANCEKIIRNYANKYIVAGIRYNILTY